MVTAHSKSLTIWCLVSISLTSLPLAAQVNHESDVPGIGTRCADWDTRAFQGVYQYMVAWMKTLKDGGKIADPIAPDNILINRCQVDGWRITRIGPFDAQGFGTKHEIGMSDIVHAGTCVEASFLGIVDDHGIAIGGPPIVQHHTHVIEQTSIFEDSRARGFPLFDRNGQRFHYHAKWRDHVHGRQCDSSKGGVGCFLQTYPSGYGQLYNETANIDLTMVEVGPVAGKFWYELAFRDCQSKNPRYLSSLVWGSPFHLRPCAIMGKCELNYTFVLQPNATSALWYTIKHQESGKLLSFDLHTHSDHLVRALIFRGTPESVGLNKGEWMLEHPWTPRPISPQNLVKHIEAFSAEVYGRSDFVCTYEPTVETLIDGSRWIRRGYPNCSDKVFNLTKGEFTTVLGFFDTRPSASRTYTEYFQHMSVMGLWELSSGEPPNVGAHLSADRELWDEEPGTLRDWDYLRAIIVGGMGIRHEDKPRVYFALAVLVATMLLLNASCLCACMCCCKKIQSCGKKQFVPVPDAPPHRPTGKQGKEKYELVGGEDVGIGA